MEYCDENTENFRLFVSNYFQNDCFLSSNMKINCLQ